MIRNNRFTQGQLFHVCNKSIANFGIFKNPENAYRFTSLLDYYNSQIHPKRFSHALRGKSYQYDNLLLMKNNMLIKFICYCIMPDHYHMLIKVLKGNSLSKYMNDVQISFTRFFNTKFKRKGPLWQSPFRAVKITTEEQLLHVTRYIHLNPTTAKLVSRPENWVFSSYRDYIRNNYFLEKVLNELAIKPKRYKKFCEDQINYQIKLKQIKNLLLE